jgi:hypothetical protein
MASASASVSASKSRNRPLSALDLCLGVLGVLGVIRSNSGMTPFGFSVGAKSVGEQYTFNIEIHTQLEGRGLIVRELYTQLDWSELSVCNTYIGESKTHVLILMKSFSMKGDLYEG